MKKQLSKVKQKKAVELPLSKEERERVRGHVRVAGGSSSSHKGQLG